MTPETCVHCLGEISPHEGICEGGDNGTLAFCCPACRTIYHLINEAGFERFYREREGWKPGRPEIYRPDSSAFSVRIENGMAEADLVLAGLRCSSCIWLIERYVAKLAGVVSIRINYATHKAKVEWRPEITGLGAILARIGALGYRVVPFVSGAGDAVFENEKKTLLIRLATACFFTFQVMLLSVVLYEGYFAGIDSWTRRAIGLVLWGLATPVIFYAGYPFIKNTLLGLRFRTVSMDTLVFIGSMSAYLYSIFSLSRDGEVYFETASMIVTLILLGRFLETGARQKATRAIGALMSLQPSEARAVKENDQGFTSVEQVPISSLLPGDQIEVRPGDTIPFDCKVVEGESEVDESMLTGEAIPVLKAKGDEVFSGTSNRSGRLLLRIERAGNETVLAGIIRAVEEAQAGKAPVERMADRVTVWFVPAMLIVAGATFFFWLIAGTDSTAAMMNGISVLVIACPCALGLATPMAILTGSSRASRAGLLIRSGDVLETLSGIDTVAFDKTGTITTGKPVLEAVKSYTAGEEEVLQTAAALEKYANHTIARAIIQAAGGTGSGRITHFKNWAGKGIEGLVDGLPVIMGSARFIQEEDIDLEAGQEEELQELSTTGGTVVGLAYSGRLMGWMCVNDSLRPEAKQVVTALRRAGCMIVLLTGDSRQAAVSTARAAGIAADNVYAELTPVEKAGIIRKLQSQGRRVLMIGDGINDAPALTEADTGAAMGRATDIARQSANVVFMREDLNLIPFLLRISNRTLAVIKQNLFWAFSYNIVAVPLAAAGLIHPIISAGLMATSSLLVVGNSFRLRR